MLSRNILRSPTALSLAALLVIGCGDDNGGVTPPPPTGTLSVSTTSSGSVLDPDGYTLVIDGTNSLPVGVNDSASADIPVGQYSAELTGLADNCGVHGENPVSVTVTEGGDIRIDFRVSCPPFYDWIAFEGAGRKPDGLGIYLIRPDGSGEMKLTRDTLGYSYPVWSPDATEIAFTRRFCENRRCGPRDLYVLDTRDLSERRLTVDAGVGLASWSPDGSRLAYDSFAGEPQSEAWGDLYTINADGSDPVNLTAGPETGGEPGWSPNGRQIAFAAGDGMIWVIDVDGSNRQLLVDLQAIPTFEPAWSPDGSRIAFTGPGDQADNNVWVMNADGSNPSSLTEDGLYWQAWRPSWSPDGTQIAYWAYKPDGGHSYQIYVMNNDGSSPTRLTFEGVNEGPYWSRGP
jgi:TolB protein